MMSRQKDKWKTLLLFLGLLILTSSFEVSRDEWENLSPDITALHHLQGMSEQMSHGNLSQTRRNTDQNLIGFLTGFQGTETFTTYVINMKQGLSALLEHIEQQKTNEWLISASEISHSYGHKLLVMTDKENSTNEQVQQEYGIDPQKSVIITKECLLNESCVAGINRATLVKIFGKVSADGQKVSGFSGSSLADLILNTTLRGATLFSLDRNTTSEFQQNFTREFKKHQLRVVLETNQENYQVYKMMDESDSVSSYRIPQRPADPSTRYDNQQIIILQDDKAVNNAANFLYEKHPSVSSVYSYVNKEMIKQTPGKPMPLTNDSRLVLVGHGHKDKSGMKVAGYQPLDVSKLIQRTFRRNSSIQTTRLVACEVGSDPLFIEYLLKNLSAVGILTTLHLWNTIIQVTGNGRTIAQDVLPNGTQWKSKDYSKKVVASLKDGVVIIRQQSGGKGETVFTDETNFLGGSKNDAKGKSKQDTNRRSWPYELKTYIDTRVFVRDEIKLQRICHELESLSWGLFYSDQPPLMKGCDGDPQMTDYVIGRKDNDKITWIEESRGKVAVLNNCYKIESGADIRTLIRHYAADGDAEITYLMVSDWIFQVHPKDLYVYPVGKKLQQPEKKKYVQEWIKKHNKKGTESYNHIRDHIPASKKKDYPYYIQSIFQEKLKSQSNELESDLCIAWYFTASIVIESARNFRTFPLILMALNMDEQHRKEGKEFFFDSHPMAGGGHWIDPGRRGFGGSAAPKRSSPSKENSDLKKLREVIQLESDMFTKWEETVGKDNILKEMSNIVVEYKVFEDSSVMKNDYRLFKEGIEQQTASGAVNNSPRSGPLGGHNDGFVSTRDLNSASELENAFKQEPYYFRTAALFTKDIQDQLKMQFGEALSGLHLKEGSVRTENGQFIIQFESVGSTAELSSQSQRFFNQMLKNVDTAGQEMEKQSLSSIESSENSGTVLGVLGLLLGLKGAAEQGETETSTKSFIAKQLFPSVTRILKFASMKMKSLKAESSFKVVPVLGTGFGIRGSAGDFGRTGPLGNIDDFFDVIELAEPTSEPVSSQISLALSVIRMVKEGVFTGVWDEFQNLPKEAGVLDKVMAVIDGFGHKNERLQNDVSGFFYDWNYDKIQKGQKLAARIENYTQPNKHLSEDIGDYYSFTKGQEETATIDFNSGSINFTLSDEGLSELCTVHLNHNSSERCRNINTQGSTDIVLVLMKSGELKLEKLQSSLLINIPIKSAHNWSDSGYGTFRGNSHSNCFYAVQKANDTVEAQFSYYYKLYGGSGDDIFFLGPQRSYVEGSAGKDTYIILEDGGKTLINNYDPAKETDTLHFRVNYSDISVYKSGDDVVLMYKFSHTATIRNWFSGELFRHMRMMSGDGVLFEISSVVITSVQLVAKGINKMFETQGQTINASQPLLHTVRTMVGTPYNDVLVGNEENNLLDGGGGRDELIGGEGEDIYLVKTNTLTSVLIENYSKDQKMDLVVIEAIFTSFNVQVEGDNVELTALSDNGPISVTLLSWFNSSADRHLLFLTKDLITFTISENKTDCLLNNKCLKSRIVENSTSSDSRTTDHQEDQAADGATEFRGSESNEVTKGNKEHNVFIPGGGDDVLEGGGGEDWYVISPDEGVKTINNQSPDLAMDNLFLNERYESLTSVCEGQNITILVHGRRAVVLQNWFHSKNHQHLQIRTSDGITAGLKTNISSCGEPLMMPLTIDCRNQTPDVLQSRESKCFNYISKRSVKPICGQKGKVMSTTETDSVREMFGSSGFDIMIGNRNENLLDPYTGGALMTGGEGKDTYVIKRGINDDLLIDNFAEDQRTDTVLVDMDFLDGSQVVLNSSTEDLKVMILTKGEELKFSLINYILGDKHQHLDLLSSDGVWFKLKSLNAAEGGSQFQIEAFKVTLKQSEVDCHLDLSAQRNLSKVQTVQGCPSRSNHLAGNREDNVLVGGWEDDALGGGGGDDTLIGGHGDDILIGGMGDDTLHGGDGNDTMLGNSGRDIFIPGPEADLMDGGSGRDTVLYRGDHERGGGVYVNLLSGEGRYADAEGDVLKDVETVIGTIYPDILVSGSESSLLKGSDGNDILVSTGGDYLVGGDGHDIYMLAFDHGSVTIDNCAKDNATDVLHLSSPSWSMTDCEFKSDRVVLVFTGSDGSTVNIELKGWSRDDDECGHLVLLLAEEQSVSDLLQQCQLRTIIYLCLFLSVCVFCLLVVVVVLLWLKRKQIIRSCGTAEDDLIPLANNLSPADDFL